MFNINYDKSLNSLYEEIQKSTEPTIEDLIKDIKDDSNGIKYVYLQPFADDSDLPSIDDSNAPRSEPEKIVNTMAKSAIAKRS